IPPSVIPTPTQTLTMKFTPRNGDISGDTGGESKSCTNGERSPQAMLHQRQNFTTRNDDNNGEKFITNQRQNPPPTTATLAKSESVINDKSHL
ncbi:12399_t:CDS:1, partial [Gigaspora rosea]